MWLSGPTIPQHTDSHPCTRLRCSRGGPVQILRFRTFAAHRKIMGNVIKAFVCHLWTIFMVNIKRRYGPKLHRIMLLHFGLVAFRLSSWEKPNNPHVHDFGISGRVHDSKNQQYVSLATPGHSKQFHKHSDVFKHMVLDISTPWKSSWLDILEKTRADNHATSLWNVLKSWIWGRFFQRAWNEYFGKSWIGGKDLATNMKWHFINIRSISSQKH